ncbi:MAG: T9SS type A sorting domain-containing protein [Chitinophagaceae bacterium]
MKVYITLLSLLICFSIVAQIPVTAVSTTTIVTPVSTTYTNAGNTYNWGVSPNNSTVLLTGFTAGGLSYGFSSGLSGTVKLRRVNNALVTGNFSLIWAEYVLVSTNEFNMFPGYQDDMEPFFNNHTYNKGTDNFFDNTSANCNNIERLDWLLSGGYSTPVPGKIGFAIFDRGPAAAHDAFCIAAITSLDGSGNPATYGPIVRVVTANYGDLPASGIVYRILKGPAGTNLLDANPGSQNRGGVFISLQSMGIAASSTIYGYSLFSNDLPVGATPADLVDYTNTTNFPITTATGPGGVDLIAVTGIYVDLTVLPVHFISFGAVENNDIITLKWKVENETSADRYSIERSTDGIHYSTIKEVYPPANNTGANNYSLDDKVGSLSSSMLYYRIKQYDHDGSFYYSKVLAVNRNKKSSAIVIYPNPVADNLFINITAVTNDKATIKVTNSTGAQVIVQQVQLTNGNNFNTINGIDKLPGGVYQLSVIYEPGETVVRQFIKQ